MKYFQLEHDETGILLDDLKRRWFQTFHEVSGPELRDGLTANYVTMMMNNDSKNDEKRKEISNFFDQEVEEKSLTASFETGGAIHVAGLELARWAESKGVEIKQPLRIGKRPSYADGWYEQLAKEEAIAVQAGKGLMIAEARTDLPDESPPVPPGSFTDGVSSSAPPRIPHVDDDSWQVRAQKFAAEYIERHKLMDLFPSQTDVCKYLVKRLREEKIYSGRGPLTLGNIRREAIQGDWWKKNSR